LIGLAQLYTGHIQGRWSAVNAATHDDHKLVMVDVVTFAHSLVIVRSDTTIR